jgi:hypothetical protein
MHEFEGFLVAWYLDPAWLAPTAHPAAFCCAIGTWLDETDLDWSEGTFSLAGLAFSMMTMRESLPPNADTANTANAGEEDVETQAAAYACLFVSSFSPSECDLVQHMRVPALRQFFAQVLLERDRQSSLAEECIVALPPRSQWQKRSGNDCALLASSWQSELPRWLG